MRVAYVRVSTTEQNESRQVEALKIHDIEKWYIEKVSAKTANRPKLSEMLDFVREGDIIYIHDFSRLARNTADLLKIVEKLQKQGVTLRSNKEQFDTESATGKLMLTMLAAINEFERAILLERQREGIAIAKANQKYKGRQSVKLPPDFSEQYQLYLNRRLKKTDWAKRLGVSRPTLDRMIAFHERKSDS